MGAQISCHGSWYNRSYLDNWRNYDDEELKRAIVLKRKSSEMRKTSLTKELDWEFILASNDKALDGGLMLKCYKGKNPIEKGFRFL